MKVELKTLTPLWTGGVERNVDRIHETGLIGSLRWWYEAILRGLDGWACDPTKHKCKDEKHCAACELFGATGWSRKFRLNVEGELPKASSEFREIKISHSQDRGWRLGSGALSNNLTLSILPMRSGEQRDLNALAFLFSFIAGWGALGARTQVGYGVVHIENIRRGDQILPESEIVDTLFILERIAKEHPGTNGNYSGLPDIRDFFFARLTLPANFDEDAVWWSRQLSIKREYQAAKKQGFIPSAPAVRYEMRGWFRKQCPTSFERVLGSAKHLDDLRHDLMGTTQGGPNTSKGSRLYVSHLYQTKEGWEFRVWGWVPDLSYYNVKREALMQAIEQELASPRFSKVVFGLDKSLQLDWHCFDQNGKQSVADYLRGLVC